jgi:hypothetical protein
MRLKKPADAFTYLSQLSAENSTRIDLVVSGPKQGFDSTNFWRSDPEFSRSRLQQLIRDGFIRLNNAKAPRQSFEAG